MNWLRRIFAAFTGILTRSIPVAAIVAKEVAGRRIDENSKIPKDLKPAVKELVDEAIDDALAELVREVAGR